MQAQIKTLRVKQKIAYCFLFSEFYVPLKDRAVKVLKLRHVVV